MGLLEEARSLIRSYRIDLEKDPLRKLARNIAKSLLILIFLLIFLIARKLQEAGRHLMSATYGILRPCARCVYGKSRETLIIISGAGYSRDDEVLVVMNYKGANWTRFGSCVGYRSCGHCLEAICSPDNYPCEWRKI